MTQKREQTTVDEVKINEEVRKDKLKGLVHQITGALLAFSAFAGVAGFGVGWLNEELINSFGLFLYAAGGLAYTVYYGIYKNHFSGKKAQLQNKKLKEENLK